MGDTQITTQSALAQSNFVLQEFADNLSAHSNGPLSLSHGINTFPGLNPDSGGNDRTYFEDSHSNVVGTRHIRFVIDGVSYWAPGLDSTLAGQPSGSNVTTLQGTSSNGLGAGDDNWVTVFEQQSLDSIGIINANYLLPHTKLAHWETHGSMTVEAQTTLDSGGYEIGDTVVKLSIGGIVYTVPTHTRFGGPAQWWSSARIFTSLAFPSHNTVIMGNNGDNNWGSFYYKDQTPIQGTRPRTVTWQINSDRTGGGASWLNIPPAGGYATGFGAFVGNPSLFFFPYAISPTGLISTPNQLFCIVSEGENWPMSECVVRAKIVSGTRTTYTGLCQFLAQDDSSGYYITYASSICWPAPAPITLPGVLMHYVGYNQYA